MSAERRTLPARSTRGLRLRAAIDEEEAKADDAFWNQAFFADDGDGGGDGGGGGASSDSSVDWSVSEEDIVDDDFDLPEDEGSSGGEEGAGEASLGGEGRGGRGGGKRYADPAKNKSKKKKRKAAPSAATKGATSSRRTGSAAAAAGKDSAAAAAGKDSAAADAGDAVVAEESSAAASLSSSSADRGSAAASRTAVLGPSDRAVRASTTRRSLQAKENEERERAETQKRRDRLEDARKRAQDRRLAAASITQEELLAEAERTERLNAVSLEALMRLADEQKAPVVVKRHAIDGPYIRWWSRSSASEERSVSENSSGVALSGPEQINSVSAPARDVEMADAASSTTTVATDGSDSSTLPVAAQPPGEEAPSASAAALLDVSVPVEAAVQPDGTRLPGAAPQPDATASSSAAALSNGLPSAAPGNVPDATTSLPDAVAAAAPAADEDPAKSAEARVAAEVTALSTDLADEVPQKVPFPDSEHVFQVSTVSFVDTPVPTYLRQTLPRANKLPPAPGTKPGVRFSKGSTARVLQGKKEYACEAYLCPVTGLPARYWDPHTGIPFFSVEALRSLRTGLTPATAKLPSSVVLEEVAADDGDATPVAEPQLVAGSAVQQAPPPKRKQAGTADDEGAAKRVRS